MQESKPVRVQDCVEMDDYVRDCHIMMYTQQENHSLPVKIINWLLVDEMYRQKWFLVVYFPSDEKSQELLLTFGASKNQEGRIVAYRTRGKLPVSNSQLKLVIGKVQTSPKLLLSLAQQHPYNETYAPIFASLKKCHSWLDEFVKMISPELELP